MTAVLDRASTETPSLALSIYGDRVLPLAAYTAVLDQVRLALADVDVTASPGRQARVVWGVSDMHRGKSLDVLLEPVRVPRHRDPASLMVAPSALVEGVDLLNDVPEVPALFTIGTVERVGRITDRIEHGEIDRVRLVNRNGDGRETELTRATADQVRTAVKTVRTTLGSVTGTLDVLSSRQRRTGAQIMQEGSRTSVTVRLTDSVSSHELREAWEHRVRALGQVHRNAAGQVTRVDVERLQVLQPLVPRDPRSLLGLAPGATGDETVREYLAAVRA